MQKKFKREPSPLEKLPADFYLRDSVTVARELLGRYLVHETEEGKTVGRIVETEAYRGPFDAAAHSYGGRPTPRTQVMYGPGGYAYVYMIYGMYYCLNVVAAPEGCPEAVLLRALEPVEGIDLMIRRRQTDNVRNLCSGPGNLCKAMAVTREHYGLDLRGNELYILAGEAVPEEEVKVTPRINISYAGEAVDYPWRFVIRGNKFVSGPKKLR